MKRVYRLYESMLQKLWVMLIEPGITRAQMRKDLGLQSGQ